MDKKEIKYCQIGGQGVLEGVMMRAPETSALAVRRADGSIATKTWQTKQIKNKFLRLPIVRGVVNLIDSMVSGVRVITDSADVYKRQIDALPSGCRSLAAGTWSKIYTKLCIFNI